MRSTITRWSAVGIIALSAVGCADQAGRATGETPSPTAQRSIGSTAQPTRPPSAAAVPSASPSLAPLPSLGVDLAALDAALAGAATGLSSAADSGSEGGKP